MALVRLKLAHLWPLAGSMVEFAPASRCRLMPSTPSGLCTGQFLKAFMTRVAAVTEGGWE
jgi:hypothetical protein